MNKPLLEWLQLRYPDTPKTRAKQWIVGGRVSVQGKIVRRPHELLPDPGPDLVLLDRQAIRLDPQLAWPVHPRVTLLYLDGSVAVVNKGSGIISVPAAESAEISALSVVADFIAGRLKPQHRGVALRTLPPKFRRLEPAPVHRLDKFTSGVFCLAMNPTAREQLIEQLRQRQIRREYLGYVEGRPARASGTWRHWLELSADESRQRVLALDGAPQSRSTEAREAVTHYELVQAYRVPGSKTVVSKLRIRLETGLKHQIRAQAAAEGLPLIGDRLYNPHYRLPPADAGAPLPFDRQALHAELLSFEHPQRAGEPLSFQAELPEDLRELEKGLELGR